MAGQWREWVVRGVLALFVPLLVVGSAELAAQALGVGYNPSFWIPVAGTPAVATNDFFGLRFFPRSLARTPVPEKVSTAKPPNVRRVFVLGESAAMGFPEPALGLAPILEFMLGQAQPGVEWEVHNAAMTAINSHVILPIARECARLSPDVFIVLAGNNEVVGPFGPGTVFGQTGAPVWVARASIYASSMRFAQMLTPLLRRNAPREWRGLEMFRGRQLAFSDPRLARMYGAFRENMIDIVRTGRQAGAEVLLLTVPVNVRDCPPFASMDPANAANEFRTAHDLLASGKSEEALVHFRRARDFDTLRFRADSKINKIIRETARGEDVRLVDAEKSFGLAGNDLFWEHVHFTPAGTFRLASLIANELGVTNTPDFDQVRAALPVTSWDERNLRMQIAGMFRRAPFTAQAGNSRRIAELQTEIDPAALYADARPAFEAAIQLRPYDFHLLGRYASLLREVGDPNASADISARMMRLLPGRKAWHVSRGAALSEAGKHDAAINEHKAALAIDPQFDLARTSVSA